MSTSFHPSQTSLSFSPSPVGSALYSAESSGTPMKWFLESVGVDSSEDNINRWSSFIGIVVAICGNVLISLALNIQKYAHIRLEREAERRKRQRWRSKRGRTNGSSASDVADGNGSSSDEEARRLIPESPLEDEADLPSTPPKKQGEPGESSRLLEKDGATDADQNYMSSPYWWCGLITMFFGECGNFLAYGFAPASIVSPLGVVALVSNCVIAPLMLKESFRARDAFGVLVSIMGAVTVVWSAEKEETKLGPDEILDAISQTPFEVYFGITCFLIVVLIPISTRYGQRSILIDLSLVALFGGYTVLSTKGISSLISSSFYHIFTYPIAYLFAFVLASTAILQVKYVNRALQRFDSTQVIPTQFVLFTISVILGSAILYRDFETVNQERMLKFVVGCALTFLGVYLISSKRENQGKPEEEGVGEIYLNGDEFSEDEESDAPPAPSLSFNRPHRSAVVSHTSERPSLPRALSSNAVDVNDFAPSLPPPRQPLGTISEPQVPSTPPRVSRHPSTDTQTPTGATTPSRASTSRRQSGTYLLPGVNSAGLQLHGVIADRVGGSLRAVRGKRNSISKRSQSEEQGQEQEEDRTGRGRSSSLSVMLDFVRNVGHGGKKKDSGDAGASSGGAAAEGSVPEGVEGEPASRS